jgi:hypothetical protein
LLQRVANKGKDKRITVNIAKMDMPRHESPVLERFFRDVTAERVARFCAKALNEGVNNGNARRLWDMQKCNSVAVIARHIRENQ